MALSNSQLADKISELVDRWNLREDEMIDWLNGTVDGGPNNDGTYPITDGQGTTTYVYAPAALEDTVDGPAGEAKDARDKAQQWANAEEDLEVESGLFSALHHAAKADAAKSAAEDAQSAAETAESNASGHADDASLSADNAYDSETAAAASEVAAQESQDAAEAAETESKSARDDSQAARDASQSARDEAQSHLAEFKGTYYGALSEDPSEDPNGDDPSAGDWYFNTTTNTPRTFNGTGWQPIGPYGTAAEADLAANGGTVPEVDRGNTFTTSQTIEASGSSTVWASKPTDDGLYRLIEGKNQADDAAFRILVDPEEKEARFQRAEGGYRFSDGPIRVGTPSGDYQGNGSLNAEALYDDGRAVAPGLIVESGSNSNGHYIRWENGEQVCWIEEVTFSGITTSDGEVFHSDRIVWDYPADFVSEPANSGYIRAGTARAWAGIGNAANNDTDSMSVVAFRATSTTSDGSIKLIAWGFWK